MLCIFFVLLPYFLPFLHFFPCRNKIKTDLSHHKYHNFSSLCYFYFPFIMKSMFNASFYWFYRTFLPLFICLLQIIDVSIGFEIELSKIPLNQGIKRSIYFHFAKTNACVVDWMSQNKGLLVIERFFFFFFFWLLNLF